MGTPLPTIATIATKPGNHGAVRAGMAALRNFLAGTLGEDGEVGTALATLGAMASRIQSVSSAPTMATTDRGKVFVCSGTWTFNLIAVGTAGAGYSFLVANTSSGTITLDGAGSETINGAATLVLPASCAALLVTDGSAWSAFVIKTDALDLISAQTITGVKTFRANALVLTDQTTTTKVATLDMSGMSAGVTRVLGVPNASGTLAISAFFDTRAQAVSWLAGDGTPDGTLIVVAGLAFRKKTGANVIADFPNHVPAFDVYLDHFAENTFPGTTDLRAAFVAAKNWLTSLGGGVLNLGASTYYWATTASPIGLAANIRVRGRGIRATTIICSVSSTTFFSHFNINTTDVAFEDLTFQFPTLANCQTAFANAAAGRLTMRRVRFVGGVTGTSTPSHSAYVLNVSATTGFDDVLFDECEFEGVSYAWLQSNATTAAHRNIIARNCRSLNCYRSSLGINSPNADLDGYQVVGGIHENTALTGPNCLAIGVASGHNVNVGPLTIRGYWWTALHFEEKVRNLVVHDVVGELSDGDFLDLTSNNISGTWYRPEKVNISNIVAEKLGSASGIGVRLTFDGNPVTPSDKVVLSDGVLTNWATGMQIAVSGDDTIKVQGWEFNGCTTGLDMANDGTIDAADLTFKSCATAIRARKGGLIQRPTFQTCTETHLVDAGILGLQDPKFNLGRVSIGAGATVWNRLLRRVNRLSVTGILHAYASSSDRVDYFVSASWDGTTEALTTTYTMSGGGAVTGAVVLIDEASAVAIQAGGTGYTVGDVLTVSGGTLEAAGTRTTATVTAVSGGVVTAVSLTNPGEWATVPTSPAATTGGTGTGCTLNLTSVKTLACKLFASSAKTPAAWVALQGMAFVV